MTKQISEQALEEAIVADLTAAHYIQRKPSAYDKALCLDAGPLVDFVQATQPKEWHKFVEQHGDSARESLLSRVSQAVESDGVVAVLRQGVKATGCRFRLAFFQPETSLNPDTEALFQANQFTVIQQVRYSERTDHSLDLVLFLNGLPLFTAELKNPLNSQDVTDAITQYRRTRDPREPLFALGRCVAHFAVDPFLVYMATHLKGDKTVFLPFNKGLGEGKNKGAGNPPPQLGDGYSTSYLWKEIWARDRVLELMQYFVMDVRERDDDGKLVRKVIFPRYHQLESVRSLVNDARQNGSGENYLIQHSAGSGKSNSIAWLAHRLASLHDAEDKRVFDSVIVVTDRVALDRQLSNTVSSFEQTAGLVEHIDKGGRHLKEALEAGKQIIVTTLQKFPVVLEQVRKMEDEWKKYQREQGNDPSASPKPTFYKPEGMRFALVLDEAHSSQGGDASKEMKKTLRVSADDEEEMTPTELAQKDQEARGRMQHVSTFAFTATPKKKTLELFGRPGAGGNREPFNLYSMRQAIEEGFILDVLRNYVSYRTYWTLMKKVKEDPKFDKQKAAALLMRFVAENPKTIREKVEVICEHLAAKVLDQVNNKARAMLVTSSRQQAVTYKLEIDKYLDEMGFKWKTIVAFSGTVEDESTGNEYTETGMNGFPDAQTAAKFATEPYRMLIVANKFQTGFDQPLLHTMYVDKKLSGVNAVQTLSRLNRTLPPHKSETCIIDFAENAEEVEKAFEKYYGQTSLDQTTDPNDLYKIEAQIKRFGFFFPDDLEQFAGVFYKPRIQMDKVYSALRPIVERVESAVEDDQRGFRTGLHKYVDLYSFLGQIIPFQDADLEKLYQFSRCLLRLIPAPKEDQPRELKNFVDVNTIRLVKAAKEDISLAGDQGELENKGVGEGGGGKPEPEMEALSEILKLLNDRFGTSFEPEDEEFLDTLEQKLDEDPGMAASFAVNTRENSRLTFDHKVRDHVQDMIDTNFKFFKQINDKPEFAAFLNDLLFDRYAERKGVNDPS
ncbi:type I restriction endonuclease [Rubripirellula amarantea]|nr:type I restriction endonuclease [Rubripirellula amarantea]